MQVAFVTRTENGMKKSSGTVTIFPFSMSHERRYDPGNVTTDNALIGLIDETTRDTCTVAFLLHVFHVFFMFSKTANMSHSCVTAQLPILNFASSIFTAQLLQPIVSSVQQSSLKGVLCSGNGSASRC